ncbi:uncharacterized protein LOC105834946 [Monomorium pharaonis]|uniref:uncharacterized protein LOC105834946 n=1 Tax=Monomorium pharaonis TaxID=307658 RepID=UPI00063F7683|nr:uncharacterized protein LOC105834946 [Monomorium pharaonis]
MLFYALSAFTIFGLSSASEHTLPVTICKRHSPNYSACLKYSLKEAWPRFVAGIPEFKFPSLDPLFYEYGKAVFNSGEIRAEVILSNISAFGLSKSCFSDIRTHFLNDVFRLEIDVLVPKVMLEGTVKMNGTMSIFKIARKGYFNLTADDATATWDLTGSVVNDTWIVEHFRTFPSVKKLKLYFDLFSDNKEFNNLAVTFANEFWPPLYRVMLPIVSDEWDLWLTNIANNFFLKVSFSKLFP